MLRKKAENLEERSYINLEDSKLYDLKVERKITKMISKFFSYHIFFVGSHGVKAANKSIEL